MSAMSSITDASRRHLRWRRARRPGGDQDWVPPEDGLDEKRWTAARDALLGERSDELIDLVVRVQLGLPLEDIAKEAWSLGEELGWIRPERKALTTLGHLVADPVREYRFWIERGRTLHGERSCPSLSAREYDGKSVLEPGSGFGCNLFALSRMSGRYVGLEPMTLYRQFTPIFAEREGIACPEVVGGRCEAIPFSDGEFDVVLCGSAHQYMDIEVALGEMARVLRPGGQLRIIGATLRPFLRGAAERFVARRSLRELMYDLTAVANTVAYELSGRRLVVPEGASATTAPIYPTHRFMKGRIEALGLVFRDDLSRPIEDEVGLFADKIA